MRRGTLGNNLVLISFLVVFPFSLMSTPAFAEEVELKYDDGNHEARQSLLGRYHAVLFTPPSTPWTIDKVRVKGGYYGDYVGREFKLEVWNKDFDVLYSGKYPYDKFTSKNKWATLDVPDLNVSDDFYIALETGSQKFAYGIKVAVSSQVQNENSYIFSRDKDEIQDWYRVKTVLGELQKYANWMIRVRGYDPTPPPTTTPPLTTANLTSTPAETPTPTQPPAATPAPATTEKPPSKGACGPTAIALIATLPLCGRKLLKSKKIRVLQ